MPGGLNLALPSKDQHTNARFNENLKGISLDFFFQMHKWIDFNRDCCMQELLVYIEREFVEKNGFESFAEWAEAISSTNANVLNGRKVLSPFCNLMIDWDKIKYMTYSSFLKWLSIMTTPKRNKENILKQPYTELIKGEDGFYVFSDCFFWPSRKYRFWPFPIENVAYEEKFPIEEEEWENVHPSLNSSFKRKRVTDKQVFSL